MKRLGLLFLLGVLVISCKKFDDSAIWAELKDHADRITELELRCSQMNTNILSLQTLISAIQANDYITNVSEIHREGKIIGYTISFAIHDSITIYNGDDGINGENAYLPQISIKQDIDGNYYWTLDGKWITDGNNNKIMAHGEDGIDGINGKDGITPVFKIEDDFWYISYDNASSWIKLDKATGNDCNIIQVTEDESCVYIELIGGTSISIPKYVQDKSENIDFYDMIVKSICIRNWDENNDGELSYTEAANIESIGSAFEESTIYFFNEFRFFTGITTIVDKAFYNCNNLVSIELPNSLKSIGRNAFGACEKINRMVISENITHIENSAFSGCSGLTNVSLPNIIYIGEYAFSNCKNLLEIILGNNIYSIEQGSFGGCSKLTNINIGNNVVKICDSAFSGCSSLRSIDLGENLTTIGASAFGGCVALNNIVLCQHISSIGAKAFSECKGLTNCYIKAYYPPVLGIDVFTYSQTEEHTGGGYPSYVTTTIKVLENLKIFVPLDAASAYKSYSNWTTYSSNISGVEFY